MFFSISTSKLAGYILPIFRHFPFGRDGVGSDSGKGSLDEVDENRCPHGDSRYCHLLCGVDLGWLIFRAPYQGLTMGVVILCGTVPSWWLFLRSGNPKGQIFAIAGGLAVGFAAIHTLGLQWWEIRIYQGTLYLLPGPRSRPRNP